MISIHVDIYFIIGTKVCEFRFKLAMFEIYLRITFDCNFGAELLINIMDRLHGSSES